MSQKLEIYGRDDCRFCAAARAFCERRRIPYVYHDMTADVDLFTDMMLRAPAAKTVPQIFIGEHRIGGHDDLVRNYQVVQQILGG